MIKLKNVLVLVFLLTLTSISCSQEKIKPNVILIITDEHNFRTIGAHRDLLPESEALMWGNVVVETPNIDRIAHEGAIFSSMYAVAPICAPSRASIFTGKSPKEVSSGDNNKGISVTENTIAKVFRKDGYKTAYVGKWHLSQDRKNKILHRPGWMLQPELKDFDYGFDVKNFMFNRGHFKQFEVIDNPDPNAPEGEKMGKEISGNSNGANATNFSTDWLTDRAVDFINENSNNPFFCVISYPDPHGPNNVRAPYDTMYKKDNFELPITYRADGEGIPNENTGVFKTANWTIASGGHARTASEVKKLIPTYFGMVKCLDDNIKKLFDKLSSEGILDNTIIVFTADHGDLLGEHGKENKGQPYEASALIPFLIRYPSAISPQTVVNTAVNNADIMDTLISLANVSDYDESSTSGKNLTGLLKGIENNPTINGVKLNGITFSALKDWYGAFSDRFKLVLEKSKGKTKKMPWLIDLKKDPTEHINFIDENTGRAKPGYKAIAKTLAEQLKGYCSKYNKINDPEVLEQIELLINDNISADVSVLSSH